jgi:DNA-binding CsgD family transcriptional regulator
MAGSSTDIDAEQLRTRLRRLSPRLIRVVKLACENRSNDDIAAELGLQYESVETYFSRIYARLGLAQVADTRTKKRRVLLNRVCRILEGLPLPAPPVRASTATRKHSSHERGTVEVFATQSAMYTSLANELRSFRDIDKAIAVQYSGFWARDILRTLWDLNVKTTLYVQDPDVKTAISEWQRNRIRQSLEYLSADFATSSHSHAPLVVYGFDTPPSFRAILVGDEALAIGWYTVKYKFVPDPKNPDDVFELSGHDIPGLLVRDSSPVFKPLKEMVESLVQNYDQHRASTNRSPLFRFPPDDSQTDSTGRPR